MSLTSVSTIGARTVSDGRKSRGSTRSKFPPGEYTLHQPSECEQVLKNRPIHLRRCTYDGKEVTHAIDKEGFRKMLVPEKGRIIYPKIISSTEFKRMVENSHIQTKEERDAAIAAADRKKERLLRESMARKEAIRRMDLKRNREKQGRLNEIEEEARQRTMHLLERARDLTLEQEDEIKKCNKIILETKCRAIRDAQLAERRLLEREYEAEEHRQNELMEQQRINGLRMEELKEQEQAQRQQEFAKVLKEQIILNEQERVIEYERKREESRLANLNNIVQMEMELEKIKEKEAEHERARQDLIESNEQLRHFKAMEKEENRIMDMRIQQFQREKEARAAKLAEEIRLENLRKEREKERVAEQSLQANELQAQIDELNAQRIQEEVEREWRRREKEEALRRAETQKNLRESREAQINNKMKLQAMEIERERREFEKILALQKEAVCREQKEQEKKRIMAMAHRTEILKQVNEKEKEKIVSQQKKFQEGMALRAETEQRNKRLREMMERKCKEMAENNVPEIYINEVKRSIEKIK